MRLTHTWQSTRTQQPEEKGITKQLRYSNKSPRNGIKHQQMNVARLRTELIYLKIQS